MFVDVGDIKAFCEALEKAVEGESSDTVLSGEEFSITSLRTDGVQIRKTRKDGKFSNVFIDNSEMDEIVGALKRFAAAKPEPKTNIPDQGNPNEA